MSTQQPWTEHPQYTHPAPLADPAAEADGSGRHPVHVAHLVFGVVLASFVGIWGLVVTGTVPTDDLRWLTPVPWLLAGIAGLLAVIFSRRRPRSVSPAAPVEAPREDLLDAEADRGTGADTGLTGRDDT